ncbi:SpoIIIAH-like family protein [Paenibacillus sp. GCM10027626]|uniref:SpoIIIAH-like family protein n=1 Tax=Paenibacillus sp. GCM10027626 TaxID=3273411 RepID=UPI00363D3003
MNTKRQTIWLVSMLSLMVILSAYYLFTEDIGTTPDMLSESKATNGAEPDGTSKTAADNGTDKSGVVVDEVVGNNAEGAGNAAESAAALGKEDQEILKQVESQGVAGDVFSDIQYKRTQQLVDEQNKLYSVMADTKQDPQTATDAVAQLDKLEAKTDKIATVEQELEKQYNQAVISAEANDKYKVVVQSDKMEKAEAESIVHIVMNKLDLTADQVSVQFVP